MKAPKVSVLLPTYNRVQTISESINSVLSQDFKNFELLIMNDSSTDKTTEIIRRYKEKDRRIVAINNPENLGLQKTLNKGILEAKGEYIARIDDDDVWAYNSKLREQVDFLDSHKNHVIVGTFGYLMNSQGVVIKKNVLPMSDVEIREGILIACPFFHSSVMYRKSVLNEIGKYSVDYKYAEDLDLWCRMGEIGKFYNIPKYAINMRLPGNNTSYNTPSEMRKQQLKETVHIIKTYRKKYPHAKKALLKNRLELLYNYLSPPEFITRAIIKTIRGSKLR